MNHLCMESNTNKEGNGGTAIKWNPSQRAWLNEQTRKKLGAEPGKVIKRREALNGNMKNELRTDIDRIIKVGYPVRVDRNEATEIHVDDPPSNDNIGSNMKNELRNDVDRIVKLGYPVRVDKNKATEIHVDDPPSNDNIGSNMKNELRNDIDRIVKLGYPVRVDKNEATKIHVDDPPSNDNVGSSPQTYRKISGNLEIDTSGVIDDPKQGAKAHDSERKELK